MTKQIHDISNYITAGANLEDADRAVILVHGRGAAAQSMLPLAGELKMNGVSFLIPQAAENRWYPETAFGPLEANQPDLDSALNMISEVIHLILKVGIPKKKIILGGFSQGACLTGEFCARNPAQYGGLFMLSGALIGPSDQPRTPGGSLSGTPVFLGCSDHDPWIPDGFVQRAADHFIEMKGDVDLRIYPGLGHTINMDEIHAVREIISRT
jgi:predicted esterase